MYSNAQNHDDNGFTNDKDVDYVLCSRADRRNIYNTGWCDGVHYLYAYLRSIKVTASVLGFSTTQCLRPLATARCKAKLKIRVDHNTKIPPPLKD
jgi:hypothetical protein